MPAPRAALCAEYSRGEVVDTMRDHLARVRAAVKNGATELPVTLDLRTVHPEEASDLAAAIGRAVA